MAEQEIFSYFYCFIGFGNVVYFVKVVGYLDITELRIELIVFCNDFIWFFP